MLMLFLAWHCQISVFTSLSSTLINTSRNVRWWRVVPVVSNYLNIMHHNIVGTYFSIICVNIIISSIALHLFVSSLLFPTDPRPCHWCPHPRLRAAQYYLNRPRLALVSFCFTSFHPPRLLWLLIFGNNPSLDSPSEFGKRLWITLVRRVFTAWSGNWTHNPCDCSNTN